ncbi:MAG: type II toxin-antitoxin system Phd/YefM family antitoxin [Limisphaerales bacterium]
MKDRSTVTVGELQSQTQKIMRQTERRGVLAVTREGRVAAFLISRDRVMAMIETMELLSNPQATEAVREFESGKTRMHPVTVLDED